ncbi:hypothetical protein ACA910_013776 [Epithemia clementina (nom. ined.)]
MLSSYKAALWNQQSQPVSSSSSRSNDKPPQKKTFKHPPPILDSPHSSNNKHKGPLIMTTSLEHDVDHSVSRQEREEQYPFYCPPLPGEEEEPEDDQSATLTPLQQRPTVKAATTSPTTTVVFPRERHSIFLGKGKEATILSRTVPIHGAGSPSPTAASGKDWNIKVWEWEKPSAIIEAYWQVEHYGLAFGKQRSMPLLDPFGLVAWPGAVVAAQELHEHAATRVRGKRVVVLGAGVGVEAQAAAHLGAAHVLATDIHPTTLQLLQYGAEQAGLACRISTQLFDIADDLRHQPLPDELDLLIVADVLYNQRLAWQVVQRIVEARVHHNADVLVSDSQRFVTDFDTMLQRQLDQHLPLSSSTSTTTRKKVQWTPRWLPKFTGSGVLLDADQTYEVKARTMWITKDETPPTLAATATEPKDATTGHWDRNKAP